MEIRTVLMTGTLMTALLAGCGGREANPVSQYMPGDQERSCGGLKAEIEANEAEIVALMPHEDATGKNVILGTAGVFLIVPWFFMDFKEGEAVDLKALRRRNMWLREVAYDKGCAVPPPQIVFQAEPAIIEEDYE